MIEQFSRARASAPRAAAYDCASMQPSLLAAPVRSSPLPPRSGGEGSGVGGPSANSYSHVGSESVEAPPTPDPSPPRAARAGGGEKSALPSSGPQDRIEKMDDRLGKHFGHLIRKRHHGAFDLDQACARDGFGDFARNRMGVRIGG